MPPKKTPSPASRNTNISVGGDVDGNIIVGDHNTVNQTIIQKFFNIFKSDAETTDQRNRRIMLGHVENFWVKGILEKSLHGAALLDLGIKEDPDALNYPWAIKREANKETLPAGTSMLEIFQDIGLGRSLLILGAPGSGKTTMLLELTRQLIERAREDVTEPIPVVFNLSSWTEKLTLTDWLARELNNIYTIPRKLAPTWVKENKMLLLLDGLDEVKQESRDKCVDAINQFRKEYGLTSMAVCSRIQDYAEQKTRLSFDGAIDIQLLTSNQVKDYFERFGNGVAGIRQVLEKDTVLREMAETPLFLSIMTLAYKDMQSKDIVVSENIDEQRKFLFDAYVKRMFERPRSRYEQFKMQDALRWLSWLGRKMIVHNQIPYSIERMQINWLTEKNEQLKYLFYVGAVVTLFFGVYFNMLLSAMDRIILNRSANGFNWIVGFSISLSIFLIILISKAQHRNSFKELKIEMVTDIHLSWKNTQRGLSYGVVGGGAFGLLSLLIAILASTPLHSWSFEIIGRVMIGIYFGVIFGLLIGLLDKGLVAVDEEGVIPNLAIRRTVINSISLFLQWGFLFGLIFGPMGFILSWAGSENKQFLSGVIFGVKFGMLFSLFIGSYIGIFIGLIYGGLAVIQHYMLRLFLINKDYLPKELIDFLDFATDRILLTRVGGGYIFVHRLLMEHFAAMYPEET